MAGIYLQGADIGGRAVPVIATTRTRRSRRRCCRGTASSGPNEVVLGANTLAALHKHVGDSVDVRTGQHESTKLRIVGTATMPASGNEMAMGTGALLSYRLFSARQRNQQQNTIPGPNAVFIRIRHKRRPGRRAAFTAKDQ